MDSEYKPLFENGKYIPNFSSEEKLGDPFKTNLGTYEAKKHFIHYRQTLCGQCINPSASRHFYNSFQIIDYFYQILNINQNFYR